MTVTTLVVVSAVVAGVSLTAVGASAAPTGIDECTTITEPGVYELTADLNTAEETCLAVEASDVTVDGNGHVVQRDAPDGIPPGPPGYGEPAALVVGGTDPVTNVTVRNATVSVGTLYGGGGSTTAYTAGVTYRNVSDGVLAGIALSGGVGVTPQVLIAGENNTVTDVSPGRFELSGDGNLLADSTATGDDDIVYGLGVSGDGNVVENVSAYGDPAVRVTGGATVVRNSTISGYTGHAAVFSGSRDSRVVNNTIELVSGGGEFRLNNSSSALVEGNRIETDVILNRSDGTDIVDNNVTGGGLGLVESDDNTVRGNAISGDELGLAGSESNRIYDNNVGDVAVDGAGITSIVRGADTMTPGSNTWNVSARSDENVVGGNTVGGNYYGGDGAGFSVACADADDDGICDDPNRFNENNTDFLPLAADGDASLPYFEVTGIDAPSRIDSASDGTSVNATVTNVGTERDTQTVTLSVGSETDTQDVDYSEVDTRSVTLGPGETTTVTFEMASSTVDADRLTVASEDSTYTTPVTVGYTGNYQVDFVVGAPIENLSADRLYAEEDRLLRFAFGSTSAGVTEWGSAWPSEPVRNCVEYGHVETSDGWDTAEVTFRFTGECPELENEYGRTLVSLVVYSMPGETFDASTADQQTVLSETIEVVNRYDYDITLTVDLPDGNESTAGTTDRLTPLTTARASG